MRHKKSLNLMEIVRREDFIRELDRAAKISHEAQGEGYFFVYLTEDNTIKVNEAIPGLRRINPWCALFKAPEEITEDDYDNFCYPETHSGYQHEKNKGGYIEAYGRTLIHVHFHPPQRLAIPSSNDLKAINEFRKQNENITELVTPNDRSVKHINPISIIGHIIDNPHSYELFICQEKTIVPMDFDNEFMKRMEKHLSAYGKDKNAIDNQYETFRMFNFDYIFHDTEEFTRFLNDIGLHIAGLFKVTGQDYSDLNKIDMFQPNLIIKKH